MRFDGASDEGLCLILVTLAPQPGYFTLTPGLTRVSLAVRSLFPIYRKAVGFRFPAVRPVRSLLP